MHFTRSLPCLPLLLACAVNLSAQKPTPAAPPSNPKLAAFKTEALRDIDSRAQTLECSPARVA